MPTITIYGKKTVLVEATLDITEDELGLIESSTYTQVMRIQDIIEKYNPPFYDSASQDGEYVTPTQVRDDEDKLLWIE